MPKEEEIKQQYLDPVTEFVTMDEMRAFVNTSLTNLSQPVRVISQQIESVGFVSEGNGWKIDAQGNCEFNDGNFRGDITGASGTFSGSLSAGISITAPIIIGGVIKTAETVASGSTGVIMDEDGLRGYDSVLGNTFNLPTDGSAPTFSSGIINETIYEISTNAVLRTSATVGDGSANSAGVLTNNTGMYVCEANQTLANANIKALIDGTVAIKGSITITGGSGIANLSDAGSLAVLDSVGATNCDTTIINGGKIITGLLTASNITTGTLDANVVTVSNLTVGTNVGLGTAEDSAGVTTIVGNTVTTGYVNALSVTAGSVACENLTGTTISGKTITGGTLQTSTSGKRIVITSDEMSMYNSAGSLSGKIYAVGTEVQGGPWIFLSDQTYITNSLRITGTFSLHGSGDKTMYLRTATVTPSWITASGTSPYDVQINRTWKPYPNNSCDLGTSSYGWRNLFVNGYSVFGNYIRPTASNSKDLGTSSFKWRHLYLDQNLYMDSGQNIYWNGTSYYLKHDGNVFKINDDLQPISDGSKRLGYTNIAWYAVHADNYLGCNLPTSNSGIEVFKRIKKPKIEDGKAKGFHAGKRHYFNIEEFPDEMKMTDKDSKKKDIELTRTIGVTVSAVREMVEEIDSLKLKISKLENKKEMKRMKDQIIKEKKLKKNTN